MSELGCSDSMNRYGVCGKEEAGYPSAGGEGGHSVDFGILTITYYHLYRMIAKGENEIWIH